MSGVVPGLAGLIV